MKIVGVDPGKTSGISIVEDGSVIEKHAAKSLHELYTILSLALKDTDVLVVERFLYGFRYRGRNLEDPIKAIGVCELAAEEYDIKLKFSNPAILQGQKGPSGEKRHCWAAEQHAMKYYKDYGGD